MSIEQRFRHRQGLLPGAVASAVAFESDGLPPGEHRGLPSPWLTFLVSADGPVRVDGTVAEGRGFSAARASAPRSTPLPSSSMAVASRSASRA